MNDQERLQVINAVLDQPCQCGDDCEQCKVDYRSIKNAMEGGHTYHCAIRLIWGDGECECQTQVGEASQMVLDVTSNKPTCGCRLSDAWRCARDQNLNMIACTCSCHRYIKEPDPR